MKNNLPIIARDIPVFNEIAGDKAYYFKEKTPSSLAHCLSNWLLFDIKKTDKKTYTGSWITWFESSSLIKKILIKNNNLSIKDKKIRKLSLDIQDANIKILKYEIQINELQNSTSWRVTYPLRFIKKITKKLLYIFSKYIRIAINKTAKSIIKKSKKHPKLHVLLRNIAKHINLIP